MITICPARQKLLDCTGHALVLGGPGCGKTTIALMKAVKCIKDGLHSGQSVLFLSFSRAAVGRILEASKTQASKDERSLLNVQTFHSYFWDLLRSHAYLVGTPKKLKILLPHDERALSNGIKEGDLLWSAWLLERERLCREDGRIAFDQFAPLAVALFEKSQLLCRLVAQRHPLIIVDEAQDTNPHAWRCIDLLSKHTQIICLADLDQQIFDHLEGIGPERIEAIKASLSPLPIDLGTENHRSAGSEIAIFGMDILEGRVRGAPYKGISKLLYNQQSKSFDRAATIKRAIAILQGAIRKVTGEWGETIAILTTTGASAATFSAAMNAAEPPIKHKLLFDEAEALLAARFAAFLLEPKDGMSSSDELSEALDLLAAMKRANGVAEAVKYQEWADKVRAGKSPTAAVVVAIQNLLLSVKSQPFTGDPVKDWLNVKKALRVNGNEKLIQLAKHLEYLVAFNRGKRILANLTEIWQKDGKYTNAREALESALTQDQLLDGIDDPNGVQVMTIHKSKAKQFDGVIVIRESRNYGDERSSFVWFGDTPPYRRSRKILRVGVTRAKVHTLILDAAWPSCPIIGAHKL